MAAPDLFASAAAEQLQNQAPLAARLRPRTLDDVVGQEHLLGPGKPLRTLIEADRLSSVILWGPAGTGKTSLAQLIARTTEKNYEQLSAVSASVKDVREVIARAEESLGAHQRRTILFLDEVHRFSKSQQDALLPSVESGLLVLIGATTENPYFEVNPPLLSRSTLFRLHPLSREASAQLIDRGLKFSQFAITDEARDFLCTRANGDGRGVLTALEVAIALAKADNRAKVELSDAESACDAKALAYGRDDHFDVISAFIKSIRGSDIDAGLYWLARMLEAGEDPKFIARRLVILASEDIGMADSQALVIATAAAQAVNFVGLPEAQLNLAHAVVYLAQAPKSNDVTTALGRAVEDVAKGGQVPMHLRDGHYRGAQELGHGVGYKYPHDYPDNWVEQQYLPDDVKNEGGGKYWNPK